MFFPNLYAGFHVRIGRYHTFFHIESFLAFCTLWKLYGNILASLVCEIKFDIISFLFWLDLHVVLNQILHLQFWNFTTPVLLVTLILFQKKNLTPKLTLFYKKCSHFSFWAFVYRKLIIAWITLKYIPLWFAILLNIVTSKVSVWVHTNSKLREREIMRKTWCLLEGHNVCDWPLRNILCSFNAQCIGRKT